MTIPKERHVLVVFPHPDDEAFGVSGTMTTHIKQGTPVTYACLTLGEMGRNLGNPPFATRESLPEIRKKELKASAEAIGLTDLRMMGLRDKTIEFEDDEKMVGMMTELIEELNPSLIITFYPKFAVHPDHEATGNADVSGRRTPDVCGPCPCTWLFESLYRPGPHVPQCHHQRLFPIQENDVVHAVESLHPGTDVQFAWHYAVSSR